MTTPIEKWNADRIAVETEIRTLKKLIRTEPRPLRLFVDKDCLPPGAVVIEEFGRYASATATVPHGTYEDWARLYKLKEQATALYTERAASRGREHKITPQEQA